MEKVYLAVDLGAGSGRVMAAVFDGKKIVLDEISRFDNSPVDMPDGLHWNITNLCKNMYDGIYAADRKYGKSEAGALRGGAVVSGKSGALYDGRAAVCTGWNAS